MHITACCRPAATAALWFLPKAAVGHAPFLVAAACCYHSAVRRLVHASFGLVLVFVMAG